MDAKSQFVVLGQSCDLAIDWVTHQCSRAGLKVFRTFDLHTTQNPEGSCSCPLHGTDPCDCQMAVLLVYGDGTQPVSIVAHGYDNQTWFTITDTPQQRADPRVVALIRGAVIRKSMTFDTSQLTC